MSGVTINLPYRPKWSKKWIEKKLSERYFKKPYDRFMWWRGYTLKNKPLSSKHPLRDRILNGDFDQGPYLLEVELCLHKMNEKYIESITKDGTPDIGKFTSETSIDRARRKRLVEDFEKDEAKKLLELKTEFLREFKITKEEYEKEVNNCRGELIDLYYQVQDKYKTWAIKPTSVPKWSN